MRCIYCDKESDDFAGHLCEPYVMAHMLYLENAETVTVHNLADVFEDRAESLNNKERPEIVEERKVSEGDQKVWDHLFNQNENLGHTVATARRLIDRAIKLFNGYSNADLVDEWIEEATHFKNNTPLERENDKSE